MANTIVALDLGTTHIRGIEAVVKKGQLPKIIKAHSIPLDTGIIVSGNIANPDSLKAAIKKLWSEGKFTSKHVFGMANGEMYDDREIARVQSAATEEDFKQMFQYYVQDQLPYDTQDYYLDAHTLREYYNMDDPSDHNRYRDIVVVGVQRSFADTFVKVIEENGMVLKGVDILPYALIRAYHASNQPPLDANIVSVEIGGDITTLVIHRNAQPIYSLSTPFLGGVRITAAIAQELSLTTPVAEMVKRSFTMTPEERAVAKASTFYEDGSTRQTALSEISEEKLAEAESIISREITHLISHIGDLLEDAFSRRGGTPFEIVLSGGSSELFGLQSRIQSELGIQTKLLQPFTETKKLDKSVVEHQANYASIYGLLVGQENE